MDSNTMCSASYNKACIDKRPDEYLCPRAQLYSHDKSTKCRSKNTKVPASTRLQMPGLACTTTCASFLNLDELKVNCVSPFGRSNKPHHLLSVVYSWQLIHSRVAITF